MSINDWDPVGLIILFVLLLLSLIRALYLLP